MEHEFKVGDKVVSHTPTIVCENYKGIVGEVIKIYNTESVEIEYPDRCTQTAYFVFDGLKLVTTGTSVVRKFKVGDKVRVVDKVYDHRFDIGDVVTVVGVHESDYKCKGVGSRDAWYLTDEEVELATTQDTPKAFDPVSKPDGGPAEYYDLPTDRPMNTLNDILEWKGDTQWLGDSFHLANVTKAGWRWGIKDGTTKAYDARKFIYSGARLLMKYVGVQELRKTLQNMLDDPQFKEATE